MPEAVGRQPYDWALEQLRVPDAHFVTRGSREVVVAVIDLGYRHHPALDGHLWANPRPTRGDVHGWDFVDDDTSLEYTGPEEETSAYYRGHHVFVAGEVAAVAPECPVMPLRVGYTAPGSWARAVRYAVEQGARVLVIPHGYLAHPPGSAAPLFYQGVDFTYPTENHDYRRALDEAYDAGCLVFLGTADNRGRRVAVAGPAYEMMCAVGSTNRRDEPADICCSADYVEFGAPAGERGSPDEADRVWGLGGDGNTIPFTGGCMASGFAGGVAALVWSRFPHLTNDQVRQVLRNTARPAAGVVPDVQGWEPMLGCGILDAAAAVGLPETRLCPKLRVHDRAELRQRDGRPSLLVYLENEGVFDAERALVVLYDGDPEAPPDPDATMQKPAQSLQVKQIGHAITRLRGGRSALVPVPLAGEPPEAIWCEAYCLDRHDAGHSDCRQVRW